MSVTLAVQDFIAKRARVQRAQRLARQLQNVLRVVTAKGKRTPPAFLSVQSAKRATKCHAQKDSRATAPWALPCAVRCQQTGKIADGAAAAQPASTARSQVRVRTAPPCRQKAKHVQVRLPSLEGEQVAVADGLVRVRCVPVSLHAPRTTHAKRVPAKGPRAARTAFARQASFVTTEPPRVASASLPVARARYAQATNCARQVSTAAPRAIRATAHHAWQKVRDARRRAGALKDSRATTTPHSPLRHANRRHSSARIAAATALRVPTARDECVTRTALDTSV